jgi:Uma2 family endonuclease
MLDVRGIMTAMPAPGHEPTTPDHLLTTAEYAALGETEHGYTELVEGRLLMSPSPKPRHSRASYKLARQLDAQLPAGLVFLQDVDIDLGLVPVGRPGFSRRPDLIVIDDEEFERVDAEDGIVRASAVRVVIEIVSPGSRRIDNIDKRGEYADAGIPWYWIVDLSKPVSLVACYRTDEFGYQDHQSVTGTFTTAEPFPVTIDLDRI